MTRVMAVASIAVAGCFISPVIPIGSGKSSSQAQQEGIARLVPAQLTAKRVWKGEARVARVRVWADDEYRAQNIRWQHGFDEQLDYANQVLVPMLGVRLEADYRSWNHHAPSGTLLDHLEALVEQDPGEDVVWVIGLTSSLSLVAGSFDLLGLARHGEPHLVIRGHADLEERKGFERAFPSIKKEERSALLEARRRHKTATILLHELAHSLGALHETDRDGVMSGSYSHRAAQIGDRNRELMRITLEDRLKPASARDPRGTVREVLTALETSDSGFERDEHAATVEQLRAALGAQAAGGLAGVPPVVRQQYEHAQQLLARGDHAGALAVLEPLLVAYPAHGELRLLGCQVELVRGGAKDAKAIASCERASQVGDPQTAIAVAAARLAAGDMAGGRATLVAVEARLASLPGEQAAAAWLALATQYRRMGAVTWAEAALAKSGASAERDGGLSAWIATARIRYGIPRDGARWKLSPEDDAAALAAVRGILDLVYADKLPAAARAAADADKRWPGLPGLHAARCDLEFRRGALGAARQHCTRALAHGSSSWALYLLGVLDLRSESRAATQAGIARLREVIALDPDLAQAWRTLGKALARAKATAEYEKLRVDYHARFHEHLK